MDVTTRINHLLEHLDVAAMQLTDAQHPDVIVQLDMNALAAEAEGIVEWMPTEAHEAGTAISVTLTAVRRHCITCGRIFDLANDPHTPYCPYCAAAHTST